MKSRSFNSQHLILASIMAVMLLFSSKNAYTQTNSGLGGDPAAIAELEAMVNTMGGMRIWSQLKSVHFVHRWYFWDRDSYLENEILDLTGPRSWVTMKNETYSRLRAYSPEHKYWNVINGEFAYTSEAAFENAMERAPYSIYRIARAVAIGDPNYIVKFGEEEFRGAKRLELHDADNNVSGYIVLNANKEPLVWATTQYKYTFGPMRQFGNLRVPDWAVTANGGVTYEMISLTGDNQVPDPALFIPPAEYINKE
ncbi:MAG: hypothetical protein AAF502_21565 [Bacteroidota bacterium]